MLYNIMRTTQTAHCDSQSKGEPPAIIISENAEFTYGFLLCSYYIIILCIIVGCERNTYYCYIIMAIAHCVRRDFRRHDYHRSNSWLCLEKKKKCLTIYLFVYTFDALSWTADIVDFHRFVDTKLTKIILFFWT